MVYHGIVTGYFYTNLLQEIIETLFLYQLFMCDNGAIGVLCERHGLKVPLQKPKNKNIRIRIIKNKFDMKCTSLSSSISTLFEKSLFFQI